MGRWRRMVDAWRRSKLREEQARDAAAIDEFMRNREFSEQERAQPPSMPAAGDLFVRGPKVPPPP